MSRAKKLKVCMIVHLYYYRDVRVQRYADALVAAGAVVDVICVRSPHPSLTRRRGRVGVYTIPLKHMPRSNFFLYMCEYVLACILYTLWLLALFIRNRYQVIHVHNMPDFLIFSALIPRLFGAKLILDVHDPMPEFFMSKYHRAAGSTVVRLVRLQERLSTKFTHAVIAANPHFTDNLVQRGTPASKITVVNNLPDLHIFDRSRYETEPRPEQNGFSLIYPGTIAPRYGLDIAIQALPLLITHIPDVRLVIVGHQVEYVHQLAALAEELGVSAHVEFKPLIPVDQVAQLMYQSDVGIYPALRDPHMEIAMPTKVLEYAAMGIPIVAARLKVLEVMFPDSAVMFFTPGSQAEFATCVLELYHNPARRQELVHHADAVLAQHTWRQEQQAYFGLLERLLPDQSGLSLDSAQQETGSTERVS